MSRRMTSLVVASVAAGSLLGLGSAKADDGQGYVQVALDFIGTAIVNDWADAPDPCWIDWSTPPSGATRGACFFVLSLERARGYGDQDVEAMWGAARPSSHDLFDLIDGSPELGDPDPATETYFRQITKATDFRRGDVLAIDATDTLEGHTVMITGPAERIEPAIMPSYGGTKQYAVPIVDSTSATHGCNAAYPDSRWTGPCTGGYMDPGAGTAYLRVYTDAQSGDLLGFTWSVTASVWSYDAPETRPYRVGRLVNLPAPGTSP